MQTRRHTRQRMTRPAPRGTSRVRRLGVLLVAATLLLVVAAPAASADVTSDVREDAEWILRSVRPDGAITRTPDGVAIWPYLGSYAAAALARTTRITGDSRYASAAWRWLDWYVTHMDARGMVADYIVDTDGVPRSTADMDSTDATAGIFLMAVHETWLATGDRKALKRLQKGLGRALDAIEATFDVDGLTWAKPTWHVKYLMDQAETFVGLRAAGVLADALRDKRLAARAAADADRLLAGVATLWNPERGAYDWAKHGNGVRIPTDWSVLYPDSVEQAWAVGFGMVTGARAADLMDHVRSAHPEWSDPTATGRFYDGHVTEQSVGYWSPVGFGFQRVGQAAEAAAGAARIRTAATVAGRAWPFTSGEAGRLILLETGGVTP